jgi:ACS family D-galactonate transporter-like MFS transporter
VLFLSAIGHHQGYYHEVLLTSLVSFGLGLAYVSWMASFTEGVEARNPALTATGLAIWGLILRVIIFGLFIVLPLVVTAVNPLVDYGTRVQALATKYAAPLAYAQKNPATVAFAKANAATLGFATTHASVVAEASANASELATIAKFAPELAVIQKNPTLFTKLASYSSVASIPPALLTQGIAAAGGGAKGVATLTTIASNKAAITGAVGFATAHPGLIADVTKYAPQLTALAKLKATDGPELAKAAAGGAQLAALAAIPPADAQFLTAHAAAVQKASADNARQWKHWYWVAFAGVIGFLLCIPLLKGRWRPSQAKADEEAHEVMVQNELAKLNA